MATTKTTTPLRIAVDGPAASGKGTVSRQVAAHFGLDYLDTGTLYRSVACLLLNAGQSPDNEEAAIEAASMLQPGMFSDSDLRLPRIGEMASRASRHAGVRQVLLAYQRQFAASPNGALLDGRDIGTVVLPRADVKLYVDATPEVRAERRYKERRAAGDSASYQRVLDDIIARDERDMGRSEAPLRKADDAHLLDTTDLSIEAAFQKALDIVTAAGKSR